MAENVKKVTLEVRDTEHGRVIEVWRWWPDDGVTPDAEGRYEHMTGKVVPFDPASGRQAITFALEQIRAVGVA